MALVKLGPIVQAISGNIGGVVFHSGKRANVIARRPTKSRQSTQSTYLVRNALAKFTRDWALMDEEYRQAWRAYARAHPMLNRLGQSRPLSPCVAHRKWYLLISSRGWGPGVACQAPTGNITPTPIITALSFTAGGPYDVTVAAATWTTLLEYVFVQRYLEYGPRPGPGSYRYVGVDARNATTENWYSMFTAAGLDFVAGEQIRVWLRWQHSAWWPSGLVSATTTVV